MNDKVAILEDKGFGFFRVTHCGSVIADFFTALALVNKDI